MSLLSGQKERAVLTIGFIVTPGFPIMSLAALSVFEFANLEGAIGGYDIQILSEHGGPIATSSGTPVMTQPFAGTRFDTVIVGGNTEIVPTSPALIAFLADASSTSRRIASICTGAFALGEAGLLHDRRVTTHWMFTQDLAANYPDVVLLENRLFVVDDGVWTAAGNSAGIDLTLCMLENDYGIDAARTVAKIMVIDYQRAGGRPQHSAQQAIDPRSDRIQEALAYAKANLTKPLLVEDLAQAAGLSQRQFSRAFATETGTTPAKAVEKLRLEAARLMLEQSKHTIDVIAAETGFADTERMRRSFLRAYGRPPQSIRTSGKVQNRAELA